MEFYGVYYYKQSFSGSGASVYLIGFYNDLNDAKKRLKSVIGEYKPHINKTVHSGPYVGWINLYTYGDFNSQLTCNQPHSSINLFK